MKRRIRKEREMDIFEIEDLHQDKTEEDYDVEDLNDLLLKKNSGLIDLWTLINNQ